jgi:hypothetical protein
MDGARTYTSVDRSTQRASSVAAFPGGGILALRRRGAAVRGSRARRSTAVVAMAKVDVAVMINDVTGKMGTAVAKAATAVGLTLVPYCLTGARRSTHCMLRPHCRTSWTGAVRRRLPR